MDKSFEKTIKLHTDTIIHVLQIVGETASGVLQILVDCEAQVEEEASQGDDVVDAGHGIDTGEDFDYDGNDVDL